ncbi:MAG: zinc-dependent metalloprotease, partial [Pseudomonadota bacterium]
SVEGLKQSTGLFTIYTHPRGGQVLAKFPAADEDGLVARYIYASRIRAGLGSNPVGLDRGLGDDGEIIALRRIGDRLIIEVENHRYRATSNSALERKAVAESFARSVIWATPVIEENGNSLLVDLSEFIVRDALGIGNQLASAGQGNFSLDSQRSFVAPEALAFPDNVELEALLTLSSSAPGSEVRANAPVANSVTLSLHHSFVRLPDNDYVARKSDPRSGAIYSRHYDFSASLDKPLAVRLANRFRLQKTNPGSASSPVKKPIIFYVDQGAPEPIRSALIEGARWWADAFTAAGFEDAYRVELLPADVHPMDVRYNVVQWVHRQTRGWSYGGSVTDPRTGEVLKGHVILGSQRVRQDRMIFEGLAGAASTGSSNADDPLQLSLARIRQLAAHEVGHPLGFHHNMAASSTHRASVMDYPAPLVSARGDGTLDLSQAYASGIGDWDKLTVAWLYGEFDADADEAKELDAILKNGKSQGLVFVADQHSRPVSAAHPLGSLWDNGEDAIQSLLDTLTVRDIALASFAENRLANDRDISELSTVFAPIYFYHRYQTLAAAKYLGGTSFDYGWNDGSVPENQVVNAADQWRALRALAATLELNRLQIDPRITAKLRPALDTQEPIMGRERIGSATSPMFDPLYAADAATAMTLNAALNSARLNRVQQAHAQNAESPGVVDVFTTLRAPLFDHGKQPSAVQATAQNRYVESLISLVANASADSIVRSQAETELNNLSKFYGNRAKRGDATNAQYLAGRIERFLSRSATELATEQEPSKVPPGSPIGSADSCWHCDTADLLRPY